MYGPLLELIFFALIAFFIINKLLSTLGTTNEDEQNGSTSFFGENTVKDVSHRSAAQKASILRPNFLRKKNSEFNDIILDGCQEEVKKGLKDITEKIPNFNLKKFIMGAKSAFQLIVDSVNLGDENQINELVDPRYVIAFNKSASAYVGYKVGSVPNIKISEAYSFGNNVFIKILFTGKEIFENNKELNEEWTFSKNSTSEKPNWYLTNIEKAH